MFHCAGGRCGGVLWPMFGPVFGFWHWMPGLELLRWWSWCIVPLWGWVLALDARVWVAQEIEQAKDKEEEERPGNKEWLPKHLLVAYM